MRPRHRLLSGSKHRLLEVDPSFLRFAASKRYLRHWLPGWFPRFPRQTRADHPRRMSQTAPGLFHSAALSNSYPHLWSKESSQICQLPPCYHHGDHRWQIDHHEPLTSSLESGGEPDALYSWPKNTTPEAPQMLPTK